MLSIRRTSTPTDPLCIKFSKTLVDAIAGIHQELVQKGSKQIRVSNADHLIHLLQMQVERELFKHLAEASPFYLLTYVNFMASIVTKDGIEWYKIVVDSNYPGASMVVTLTFPVEYNSLPADIVKQLRVKEALEILAEECIETVTAIQKYERFGNNADDLLSLVQELADVTALTKILLESLEVDWDEFVVICNKKLRKLNIYSTWCTTPQEELVL